MKRKIKRLVPLVFIMILFVGTVSYAAQNFNFYMSPGHTAYTSTIKKGNTNQYTLIDTDGTDRIYVRYTVLNEGNTALTSTAKINGSMLIHLNYNTTMGLNSQVRLRAVNNTADNSGRFVTAAGTWTP